jgi:hypothetical protein
MDARVALYYLVAVAGFVMVVGGMWLIAKQKIYIDRESKQPVEIKLPLGVSVKSNYPALALFVLGFFPLVYPLQQINTLTEYVTVDTVRIKGLVEADAYPALVYASRAQDVLNKNGEFRVPVPFLGKQDRAEYRMLLIVNGRVLDEAHAERKESGEDIEVKFRRVVVEPARYTPNVSDTPDAYK